MESGQGKPESEDKGEADGIRLLFRNVLINALRDLGFGDLEDLVSSRSWRATEDFREVCAIADWDVDWVIEIFSAVEQLHQENEAVRHHLTEDSIALLKRFIRM